MLPYVLHWIEVRELVIEAENEAHALAQFQDAAKSGELDNPELREASLITRRDVSATLSEEEQG